MKTKILASSLLVAALLYMCVVKKVSDETKQTATNQELLTGDTIPTEMENLTILSNDTISTTLLDSAYYYYFKQNNGLSIALMPNGKYCSIGITHEVEVEIIDAIGVLIYFDIKCVQRRSAKDYRVDLRRNFESMVSVLENEFGVWGEKVFK